MPGALYVPCENADFQPPVGQPADKLGSKRSGSARDKDRHCGSGMSAAFAEPDPGVGLRQVLTGLYGWYRENEASNEHMQRDRLLIPTLDAVMSIRMDQQMASLAGTLAARFMGAEHPMEVRAAMALALDFWTWRRLSHEGMTDAGAAAVMANAVKTAADGR